MTKDKKISVRLEPDLREKLFNVAKLEDRSLSRTVKRAVDEYCKRYRFDQNNKPLLRGGI